MKVLVTGATGFLGSSLCRSLRQAGHTVRALRRPSSSLAFLDDLEVEWVIGDVLDPASLLAAMQNAEVIYHTAAQMGSSHDPAFLMRVHVEGTRNVAQAALIVGSGRLVHTSSVAALGVPDSGRLLDENHAWNYRAGWWPYGYAKHLAELEIQRMIEQGLDAVIVNPSVVCGPGDIKRISHGVLYQMARGKLPPIAPPGGLNAVHIDDVVAGHLAAAALGRTGERYILAGENLTHRQFLNITAEVMGKRPPPIALSTSAIRLLSRLLRLLSPWRDLPISPELLRLAGLYFYYDNRKALQELRQAAPSPYRQAAEEAYAWYLSKGIL